MQKLTLKAVLSISLLSVTLHGFLVQEVDDALILTTIYGQTSITEPVLIELIKSPVVERLKKIHQYGVTPYVRHEESYTRYEHSLGVMLLLKQFGASLEEQIDGLLHDASHTVFSHIGDSLFNYRLRKESYQDKIHEWFLEHEGIIDLLKKYSFEDACSKDAKKYHRMLEQDRPDLCADRIEYNLTGALRESLLVVDEIQAIIKALHYGDGNWYFDNKDAATKFGRVSLQLSQMRWGGDWNLFVDYCASQILLRALELGIINTEMVHFGTDDAVMQILVAHNDPQIMKWRDYMYGVKQSYHLSDETDYDFYIKGKFSGTDPLVKINNKLLRVSELDSTYAQEFALCKACIEKGYYFKLID